MSEKSETATVLDAFSEALRFWAAHVTSGDLKTAVPPAKLANPLEELEKTTKLIKAHTTKVGILFEPSKISLGSATHSTVADLSKSYIVFVSALALVSPLETSQIFYDEIRSISASLVTSGIQFTDELKELLNEAERPGNNKESEQQKTGESYKKKTDESEETSDSIDARLVSVGKIWNTCDVLGKLLSDGKIKFLEKKTKMHLSLIEDGLDEFEEWTEDPDNFDDDDPFGLDEFSDEEVPVPADSDDSLQDRQAVVAFAKVWLQKFKLVKLLFLSLTKSLSALVSGENIDLLFKLEGAICKNVDQLIVGLMVDQILDDEITHTSKDIDKSCFSIVKLLRDANKKSESKVKWCASWEAKYTELLLQMY